MMFGRIPKFVKAAVTGDSSEYFKDLTISLSELQLATNGIRLHDSPISENGFCQTIHGIYKRLEEMRELLEKGWPETSRSPKMEIISSAKSVEAKLQKDVRQLFIIITAHFKTYVFLS
jgi:hypothetical protein